VIPTETGVDLIEKAGSVIAAIEGRYRTSLGRRRQRWQRTPGQTGALQSTLQSW
jgi:hypothetical protein